MLQFVGEHDVGVPAGDDGLQILRRDHLLKPPVGGAAAVGQVDRGRVAERDEGPALELEAVAARQYSDVLREVQRSPGPVGLCPAPGGTT